MEARNDGELNNDSKLNTSKNQYLFEVCFGRDIGKGDGEDAAVDSGQVGPGIGDGHHIKKLLTAVYGYADGAGLGRDLGAAE
jgi:hypothetical protein